MFEKQLRDKMQHEGMLQTHVSCGPQFGEEDTDNVAAMSCNIYTHAEYRRTFQRQSDDELEGRLLTIVPTTGQGSFPLSSREDVCAAILHFLEIPADVWREFTDSPPTTAG